MRIDQIKIANFRCFEELELKPNPNFNVVIGDNGFGKSSILKALSVSISGFQKFIGEASNRNIERNDIRLEYINEKPVYHVPVNIETWGELLNTKVNWKISKLLKEKESVFAYSEEFNYLQNKISVLDENIELPVVAYYPAGRFWNDVPQNELKFNENRFQGYFNALKPTVNYKFLTEWLIKMKSDDTKANLDTLRFNIVKNAVLQCIDEAIDIDYNSKYQTLYMRMQNSVDLPFNRLSDGYRNALAIISDIAFRCITLNPHLMSDALNCKGIVLIDEIDLHLHPNWQKKIVNNLKKVFPNIQFFATTHSPFIIQELDKGELMVLKNNDKILGEYFQQSIEDIAENIQGVKNPQWSIKREALFETAKDYFNTLEQLPMHEDNVDIEKIRTKLDTLLLPFADNLAFVAFLEQQRLISEIDKKNKKK